MARNCVDCGAEIGSYSRCLPCRWKHQKEYQRQYYEKNKERCKAYNREYYARIHGDKAKKEAKDRPARTGTRFRPSCEKAYKADTVLRMSTESFAATISNIMAGRVEYIGAKFSHKGQDQWTK